MFGVDICPLLHAIFRITPPHAVSTAKIKRYRQPISLKLVYYNINRNILNKMESSLVGFRLV